MMRVGVGARGRRYQYIFGTSRIRPTVARVMKEESLGSVQIRLMALPVSISPIFRKMIKDGTSARLSSSIDHPTVRKMALGFILMFMVRLS